MNFSKLAVSVIFASSMAACSGPTHMEDARNAGPGATAFSEALRQGYVSLAAAEQQEADGRDSINFAEKAIRAATDGDVAPYNFSTRHIKARFQDELGMARERLMVAKNHTDADSIPRDLARAQVMFDCWMQEQEENWQPSHIEACKRSFEAAMATVEDNYAELARIEPEPEPEPEVMVVPKAIVIPGPYVVYFDFDRSMLSRAARGILNQVLADMDDYDYVVISLAGHADRSGPDKYNNGISARRAQTVAGYLVTGGVDEGKIIIESYGEGQPAVPTADGVRESRNRRVEIVIE